MYISLTYIIILKCKFSGRFYNYVMCFVDTKDKVKDEKSSKADKKDSKIATCIVCLKVCIVPSFSLWLSKDYTFIIYTLFN